MFVATPRDGIAFVTGASSGIGRQVALDLAGLGFTVVANARRADALADLAASAPAPGRIIAAPGDATDTAALAALIDAAVAAHGPIALAFLNVGINAADIRHPLDAGLAWTTFETNVKSVVNAIEPLARHMRQAGRGQIAVNGSVAGYVGFSGAGYYGASKAALVHLCETLRLQLAGDGITVQLVSPGFVETPLTAGARFPMPFLMPVSAASRRIIRGFGSGRFEITFPRRLSWLLKTLRILPYWVYFPLAKAMLSMQPARRK